MALGSRATTLRNDRHDGKIIMNRTTKLAVGATVILWASAFAGIRAGLQDYSPIHLAVLRFGVASIALGLVALFKQTRRPALRDLPRLILVGLCGIPLYNLALNYGEVTISAGAASFIISTAPIFTAILSILMLQERVPSLAWLGILISFIGVGLIALGGEGRLNLDRGALFILGAAVVQSFYFVLQKPLLQRYTSFEVVSYALWLGTAGLLLFTPGLTTTIRQATPVVTLAVIYLGIFPAALAFFCWSYALARIEASRATTFLYLVPVVSTIIAFIWLGEIPSGWTLIGGGLVLGGVILVTTARRPIRVFRPPAQPERILS